jgi:phosphoribosylformylglycinamidine synthase
MIYRIDVTSTQQPDGLGLSVKHQLTAAGLPVASATCAQVYFVDTDADLTAMQRAAAELLADPIVDTATINQPSSPAASTQLIEVHLKPGVMDPVAASTEMALREMGIPVREVRTGRSFALNTTATAANLQAAAEKLLASTVIESVHRTRFTPTSFPAARQHAFELRHITITTLDDAALMALSRNGHLFLNLAEMQTIRAFYQSAKREPTDLELESLAQTWSEHCVHKTLKSAVEVRELDAAGNHISTRHYKNLIKETIFASTQQLIAQKGPDGKGDFCLSVFKDNAGVVSFDDTDAVCMKVETHNRPSALDPYGGAATGAGGCIRDVLGTGLGAKPIANTDVFCVAYPDAEATTRPHSGIEALPPGVLHPKRILQQVVAGVRDYGNRMGIPTINGAVYFDDRYVANPLVFCGCVGLIPRDKIKKAARPGDAIIVMGGRTGRDGIHGATFSSAELTSTHADEFSHAVQIGNAITEKKVTDVVLAARDAGYLTAITDCGAGGLSSAVGEMGGELGAEVHLERVPLKYAGLRYDEIWISEAQERMVMAVPQDKVQLLLALAASEDVEATVIGHFGTPEAQLIVKYAGTTVGQLPMHFLHDGLPMPTRSAVVRQPAADSNTQSDPSVRYAALPLQDRLLKTLAHPNTASKHWIIRQYDHEVQGGSVIKPLVGPLQLGPSDAAVIRPKLSSHRAVAVAVGMAPHIADPYAMAIAAIDESIRNVLCTGGDFTQTAILDNFCWPGTDDPESMGALVRTAEACRDAALAFAVPFISGKDSLHNQFTNKATGKVTRIPNTLLVSSISIIADSRRCLTMDLKLPGSLLTLVTPGTMQTPTLQDLARLHRAISALLPTGQIAAAHDLSDGGLLTAATEMAFASPFGLNFMITSPDTLFTERTGAYLLEIPLAHSREVFSRLTNEGCLAAVVADVTTAPRIVVPSTDPFGPPAVDLATDHCRKAWLGTLDW